MSVTDAQTVLVVDDKRNVADLYSSWLGVTHDVRTAYGGEEAMRKLDESVDIAFLDRQMPGVSGDRILDRIRRQDHDCRVVMVTAVDPDLDIIEMGFDDYLLKPVTRVDLEEAVEDMREREAYSETVRTLFSLVSKKATLEAERSVTELRNSEKYQRMLRRIDDLSREADAAVTGLDDYNALFQDLPSGH